MTNEQDPVTLADKLTIRMRAYAASEKGSDNEARQAIALADLIGRNEKAIERAILTQHGRHEGLREAIAELVHGAMVWAAQARGGEPKPWQEGNSTAEDEARRTARKIAALSTDTAQPPADARTPDDVVEREIAEMRRKADDWRRPNLAQVEGPNDLKIYGGAIADDIERWAELLAASGDARECGAHGVRWPHQCDDCDRENPMPTGYDPLAPQSQRDARGRALREAVNDFRWRALQCRTNRDAYCEKAAGVWDAAADALETKYAVR